MRGRPRRSAGATLPYDDLITTDPNDVEPWKTLLVENDPGFVVGESPVLIIHGENDEQIPVVSSQLLLDRMCGIGQVVERRTYPGQSHAGVIGPSFAGHARVDRRAAGRRGSPHQLSLGLGHARHTRPRPIASVSSTKARSRS